MMGLRSHFRLLPNRQGADRKLRAELCTSELSGGVMEVNLIDGTYELFRHFYAIPSAKDIEGREVAAVRGVLVSLLNMMQAGTTYIGVATDHVIESFRNRTWPGYKTG